jgi:twitching motility protein PilU
MERDQAVKFMNDLLRALLAKNGSDLFLSATFPPAFKVDGRMTPVTEQALTPQHTMMLARSIMNDKQQAEFERTKECNFAIAPSGIGRFRVNCYVQRGSVALVLRPIPEAIPTFEELHLPEKLKEIALEKRGLVIFVGGTGSGKTTSLAAMVGYRNENSHGHIVTIEDPIEFVHPNRNCLVSQREVGVDTESWEAALKNTLRQAPDLILIGEIRDRATMEHAIAFAETGHLAMGTLHANNANQALDRIINFFPEDRRQQLLMDLSLNLKAICSLRLIPREGSKGRIPAVELLLTSPYIADLILKGEVHEIKEQMKKSQARGMQTFDQALVDLYERHEISQDEALRYADSKGEVQLAIRLKTERYQKTDPVAGPKGGDPLLELTKDRGADLL